jgi:hypothetical protein
MTNYHVLTRNTQTQPAPFAIRVFIFGDHVNHIPAVFVGGSARHDIAILRIAGAGYTRIAGTPWISAVRLPDENKWTPSLGGSVIAVGNPLGEGLSISQGVVSVQTEDIRMRSLENPNNVIWYRVFRTTAYINSGNSGGGMFNGLGQLVGIVQARAFFDDDGNAVLNIGYAIPLDIAVRIAEQIIDRTKGGEFDAQTASIFTGLRPPLALIRYTFGMNLQASNRQFGIDLNNCDECDDCEHGEIYLFEHVTIQSFVSPQYNINDFLQVGDRIIGLSYVVRGVQKDREIRQLHNLGDFMMDIYRAQQITFIILRNDVEMEIQIHVG